MQMARTFFRMVLRKFSEITNTKPFLVSTIFFTSMNISFFNLRFNLFSIIAKKVNQIRNNVVCVVAHLVFVFYCALTMRSCNAFQHIAAHISQLCYFLWLWFQKKTNEPKKRTDRQKEGQREGRTNPIL